MIYYSDDSDDIMSTRHNDNDDDRTVFKYNNNCRFVCFIITVVKRLFQLMFVHIVILAY